MPDSETRKRPIRSYVIRSGRTTQSQRKALEQHWDNYVVEYQPGLLELGRCFEQDFPLTVEIGFGMGDSLLQMAEGNPEQNFLGIEVHRPGVGKLMRGAEARGLTNLKVICHDATEVMEHCFKDDTLERVLIFFPDPWHKKRHHKRRIVQPEFASLLASRLRPGGSLHLATDWEQYAEHMVEVLENEPTLVNANGKGNFWLNPERPETKFERRGERLGHGVWDLLYRKAGKAD